MSEPINENFEMQQRFWAQLEENVIPTDPMSVPTLRIFLTADHIRTANPGVRLLTDEVDLSLIPLDSYDTSDYEQSA